MLQLIGGLLIIFSMSLSGVAAELTHGPILGGQTSSSMRVWGRTSRPAKLSVQYGLDAKNLDQTSPAVMTGLDNDNTGVIYLTDLKPGQKYAYRMLVDGKPSGLGGTLKTLPTADQVRDAKLNPKGLFNFRFEFACGNNQDPKGGIGPSLPTFTTMNREIRHKTDFAILNGDWLYEENRDYDKDAWLKQVGATVTKTPSIVRIAPTITGIWENYKTYMARGKNLAEWHRHIPTFFTFDDHELINDLYGSGEVGRRDRRAVFRDISIAAWYDYLGWSNPLKTKQGIQFGRAALTKDKNVLFDSLADFSKLDLNQAATLHVHWGGPFAGRKGAEYDEKPGEPSAGIYRVVRVIDAQHLEIEPAPPASGVVSYSIGRRNYGKFRVSNCDFFMLDTRSHRQMHDVRNPTKKGLTMLGHHQTEWLMDEMKKSDAEFFFVVSSVNFMIPHVGGGGVQFDVSNKDDAWTVFLDEREKLINFWDSLKRPVFVLTGDLHNSFAIKVTDRVWEFASGPHNSVNHRASDEGDRPVTGRYQYGPRPCEIRWSTTSLGDVPRTDRHVPSYCVVQVNNVHNNPLKVGGERWVAYPQPQVIFQYYNGFTGDLRYAEAISLTGDSPLIKKSWSARQQEHEK